MDDYVTLIGLDELQAWDDNPRTHDIPYLTKVISENGFVVYPNVWQNKIIAGHGRIQALWHMRRQGMPAPKGIEVADRRWLVPCVVLDHLTFEQAERFAITENIAHERGRWDDKKLQKLRKRGLDLAEAGFSASRLTRIRQRAGEIQVPDKFLTNPEDIPHAIWANEPEFNIPILLLDFAADYVHRPFLKWGSKGRKTLHDNGTVHFYTSDYKFSALWKSPQALLDTMAVSAVEPNFSTQDDMPRAEALWRIYQKRYLARLWQEEGVQIIVDLNVAPRFAVDNLRGVPKGWPAFCTRQPIESLDELDMQYQLAAGVCGGDPPIFIVYGGGQRTAEKCADNGWVWIPEYSDVIRGRYEDGA